MSNEPTPSKPADSGGDEKVTYEPPRLTKYGSLAKLTRSGTGTVMEGGGPSRRFA